MHIDEVFQRAGDGPFHPRWPVSVFEINTEDEMPAVNTEDEVPAVNTKDEVPAVNTEDNTEDNTEE